MAGPLAVGAGKLKVNGIQLPVADEIRIMPMSVKREGVMGLDGSLAMQETPQPVWIEASLRDSPDIDLTDVIAQLNATVMVELNNGSSYEIAGAFFSGDGELDVKDGKISARWTGATCRRVI